MKKNQGDARFTMTKAHHQKMLEKAIAEKRIDPLMIPIVKKIMKKKHYFTTSTCSGRITLMDLDAKEGKRENVFYRKWHSTAKLKDVEEAIEAYSEKRNLWFRQDALVFVFGADSFESAKELFRVCQEAGLKRFGIHHFEEGKVLVEVFGTTQMSAPVVLEGKRVGDAEYVSHLVKVANAKWKKNDAQLKKFNALLQKRLK